MNNTTQVDREQTRGNSLNFHSPYVFAIPRPFEDDYERNHAWFTQLLKLEKKSQQLRETMKKIAEICTYRALKTSEMAKRTVELNNRFFKKPDKANFTVDV